MADCSSSINLPPGFRFCPTDEELVLHFLYPKASYSPSYSSIIPDLVPLDPWQLHGNALSSENRWYFFTQKRDILQDQETENGFWKHLDIEEPIFTDAGLKIGLKKFLMYYIGQHPTAIETSWMMHQYHLFNSSTSTLITGKSYKRIPKSSEWVLCRVYQRKESCQTLRCREDKGCCHNNDDDDDDDGTELSSLDEMFLSLEDDAVDDLSILPF